MISKEHFLVLILFSTCLIVGVQAQSIYSPYSMLGLGEINDSDYGRTSGMGNIGIGMRELDYLNPTNPAAISELDSLKFMFDMSVNGKLSFFSRKAQKDNAFNANFKKLSLGFRLSPRWGISAGIKPFSEVGYQIYSEEPVEGSTATKSVYFEGSGGLYNLYLSTGFKITDNFSVGANLMYITGTIKQTEDQSESSYEKESRASQVYSTFGVQYHNRTGLTIGAIYGYKQNMSLKNKTIIYDSSGSVLQEENDRSSSHFIPEMFGVGFSLKKKKLTGGLDFKYQKWDGLKSGISSIKIVDSYSLNAGAGYTLNAASYSNHKQIQLGTSFSKSYLQVSNKDTYNYSLSAGYSFYTNNNKTRLNLSLEYGNTLSASPNYIKESYIMATINCAIAETWFKRNRIR